jgi:hypothetical protein
MVTAPLPAAVAAFDAAALPKHFLECPPSPWRAQLQHTPPHACCTSCPTEQTEHARSSITEIFHKRWVQSSKYGRQAPSPAAVAAFDAAALSKRLFE